MMNMEISIPETEEAIAGLENKFSDPDFFAKHGSEIKELQQELELRKAELEKLYSRWEELEAKKESFQK